MLIPNNKIKYTEAMAVVMQQPMVRLFIGKSRGYKA